MIGYSYGAVQLRSGVGVGGSVKNSPSFFSMMSNLSFGILCGEKRIFSKWSCKTAVSILVVVFLPRLRSESKDHISRLSTLFIKAETLSFRAAFLVCLIFRLYCRLATKYSSFAQILKGCLFKKLPALRTRFLRDSQSCVNHACFFRLFFRFLPILDILHDFL